MGMQLGVAHSRPVLYIGNMSTENTPRHIRPHQFKAADCARQAVRQGTTVADLANDQRWQDWQDQGLPFPRGPIEFPVSGDHLADERFAKAVMGR